MNEGNLLPDRMDIAAEIPQDGSVDPAAYVVAYSMVDSSRLSTFCISILLIVYGSFRSLNVEKENKENKEKEKDKLSASSSFALSSGATPSNGPATSADNENGMQTIDACQATFMPIGASLSLLVMFVFFDSLQMVFTVCTAVLAMIAFAFLLQPMCQYLLRPCSNNNKISFGVCGRFTPAGILSFCLSFLMVCVWILTGHWLLMDALGMGLCVAFIALVRLPSLKVSTLLLVGLLIYDVFWVFFSSYIFSTNVMVKVATRPADNPMGFLAKKFHLFSPNNEAPKLSLPGKLVFPSMSNSGHFSMLGLGDIVRSGDQCQLSGIFTAVKSRRLRLVLGWVMPGLLLCFVLRYDAYKRSQTTSAESGLPPPAPYYRKITYFHCSLIGYFLGLLTATMSSELFQAAQPALLYLVPFTLLPLFIMAYFKGDLRGMWHEPFRAIAQQSIKYEV